MEAERQRRQAEMEAVFRRFYGPKSKRFDPRQLLMFGIVIEEMPLDEQAIESESSEKLATRRIQHKHGRAKLPESLPRIPVEHGLKPDDMTGVLARLAAIPVKEVEKLLPETWHKS
jgi:hypothetical protein